MDTNIEYMNAHPECWVTLVGLLDGAPADTLEEVGIAAAKKESIVAFAFHKFSESLGRIKLGNTP